MATPISEAACLTARSPGEEFHMQPIRSATVIGSGIMGSQIAAHLAGCGIPVLLLDVVPKEGKNRNAIAEKNRDGLKKIKPSPLYSAEALDLISTGNTEDDLDEA